MPWGRSFDEYCYMFRLSDSDLGKSILGCADGPASFNAEMARQGHRMVSCDPLYRLTVGQINERIEATYEEVMRQAAQNQDKFVWDRISSVEELGQVRREAMYDFLGDYDKGKREGRYLAAALPHLPFAPFSFDLALCSHLLFFYSDSLSLAFHQQSLDELRRVAREIRIFPLVTYNADPSPLVTPMEDHIRERGGVVGIEAVDYEFQRGGTLMMKVS